MSRLPFMAVLTLILVSCGDDDAVPKPVGYFRIDTPDHAYVSKQGHCPFIFETSAYSRLEFIQATDGPPICWFDIHYPNYKAKIHMTYKPVENNLREYLEESRNLTYEHQIKATRINATLIDKPEDKLYGLLYELGGNVASPLQFYLTDSVNHFVRGSLYFEAHPNPDSLKPVMEFITRDISHFIETFTWDETSLLVTQ